MWYTEATFSNVSTTVDHCQHNCHVMESVDIVFVAAVLNEDEPDCEKVSQRR